jgi:glycosyltransferase involved in cell wall biosynthesis
VFLQNACHRTRGSIHGTEEPRLPDRHVCGARASGLDVQLLLLGAGPLENAPRAQAAELGVLERCAFAGTHDDTPFYGAMDLFVFPSRWEGLALVTLEAQAAGVPVLASLAMPGNAAVIPGLLQRVPLEEGPLVWAWRADQLLRHKFDISRRQCARLMAESPFNIAHSVQELARIYQSAPSHPSTRTPALLSV